MRAINLRCRCGRTWARIQNGVFVATSWDSESRESVEHALSVSQLVDILRSEGDLTITHINRNGERIWARVEGGRLIINSRHGGKTHTNSFDVGDLVRIAANAGLRLGEKQNA